MNSTLLKVKKSHELVTARYSFSLMEMRLFTIIVSLIDDRDDDFQTYRIPIKNIIRTFNIKSKTIYAEINSLTTSMLKKIITIPVVEDGKDKEIKTALVSSFKYSVDGKWVLEATFHPILKPFLLQLKTKFLLYDIKNILKISSWNSIRMYELLKSYEGIGKRVFEVEELKQILWVEEKYSKYANFKSRILLKAQQDIEKNTDIRFEFEELSHYGRRVEKIAFTIYRNKKNAHTNNLEDKSNHEQENEPLATKGREEEIRGFWVSKATMGTAVLSQYEQDYIIATLKYCKNYFKHTDVKQKAGFFLKALQEGYFKDEIQKEVASKQKKRISIQESEIQTQEKENQNQQREQKLQKLRQEFMTSDFIEAVLEQYKDNFLYSIMEKARRQGKTNKFLQEYVDRKLIEEFWSL